MKDFHKNINMINIKLDAIVASTLFLCSFLLFYAGFLCPPLCCIINAWIAAWPGQTAWWNKPC